VARRKLTLTKALAIKSVSSGLILPTAASDLLR
jgi:hypothetical protein